MSLTQLKREAANLPAKQRRQLIAYLVALETQNDEPFREKLTAKIDDNNPTHWLELKDVEQRYDA